MKTLTSLLIGCSLALAGAALAQQPVEQQSPSKNKHAPEKSHATQAQPRPNAAKPQAPPATHQGATHEHAATHQPGAMQKPHAGHEPANAAETNVPAKSTNEPGTEKGGKARAHEEPQESANAHATETDVSGRAAGMPTRRGKPQIEERKQGVKQPATEAGVASSVPAAGHQNMQGNAGARAKKPDPQQVQQIKSQHANFRAQANPQRVPAVIYNQNHRIQGSEQWQGSQYEVFRAYHPEWHDQGWYHSHYNRVELIGGGYYFWNNGYWYPAWGYSPSAQYYAYDGPIYVGQRAEPPDKVIADVQAVLQQMGYYRGEVDGLLGPLTREALAGYQADQGLITTEAIDEPTLDSLGMS